MRLHLRGVAGCLALALTLACAARPVLPDPGPPPGAAVPTGPAASSPAPRCQGPDAPPQCWCSAATLPATERRRGVGLTGPLSELSEQFRGAHAAARARMCARLQTAALVIRYSVGTVEVDRNGQAVVPPTSIYTPYVHVLKAVTHAVFLASLLADEPPGAPRREHLAATLRELDSAVKLFGEARQPVASLLSAAERARQVAILTQTRSYLGSLLQDQALPPQARVDFIKAVRPLIAADLRDAARATLRKLDETIKGARAVIDRDNPHAWESVVVVANASHQSRAGELAVQYFARLLGETLGEGARQEKRLVVLESVNQAADQRGVLAAHFVDREHAERIFGEPDRLQWDVLAEGGSLLNELLPPR